MAWFFGWLQFEFIVKPYQTIKLRSLQEHKPFFAGSQSNKNVDSTCFSYIFFIHEEAVLPNKTRNDSDSFREAKKLDKLEPKLFLEEPDPTKEALS